MNSQKEFPLRLSNAEHLAYSFSINVDFVMTLFSYVLVSAFNPIIKLGIM